MLHTLRTDFGFNTYAENNVSERNIIAYKHNFEPEQDILLFRILHLVKRDFENLNSHQRSSHSFRSGRDACS
jgi:hypothetical protein